VPLHGERSGEGRAVADGASLALARTGGRVGAFRVRAKYLDDTAAGSRWSPVATAANARRAAEDSTAIGFVGDLDSGATRVSLPITNLAEIVQVSPGSTAIDLTGDRYRPSGTRTFARVVPDDGVLERGAAQLGRRLGVPPSSVAVGVPGPALLRGCRGGGGPRFAISPYREPFRLDPRGKVFNRAYRARFGQAQPASAYGYEAISLLLSAIRQAAGNGGERQSVADAVLATRDRRSVIGEYSIEASGDTTLDLVTAYSLRGCRLSFSKELRANSP
jgi:ABC-type branched-subunit amino acid transport system substrate-binding protein